MYPRRESNDLRLSGSTPYMLLTISIGRIPPLKDDLLLPIFSVPDVGSDDKGLGARDGHRGWARVSLSTDYNATVAFGSISTSLSYSSFPICGVSQTSSMISLVVKHQAISVAPIGQNDKRVGKALALREPADSPKRTNIAYVTLHSTGDKKAIRTEMILVRGETRALDGCQPPVEAGQLRGFMPSLN